MTDKIDNAVAVADDRVELGLNTFFNEVFQSIAIELMGVVIDKFTKILVCRNGIMPLRKRFFNDVAASRYRNRIVDLRRLEFIGKRFDIVAQIGDLVGIGDEKLEKAVNAFVFRKSDETNLELRQELVDFIADNGTVLTSVRILKKGASFDDVAG